MKHRILVEFEIESPGGLALEDALSVLGLEVTGWKVGVWV